METNNKLREVIGEDRGYIQVYTGNGKGKTTAALGLAMRAIGAGKKVYIIQFMKSNSYSEHNILPSISPNLKYEVIGKPFFIAKKGSLSEELISKYGDSCVVFEPGNPPLEYVELIKHGIEKTKAVVGSNEYDLVILDEIICAIHFELVEWSVVKEILCNKPTKTEIVLTGRGAPKALIELADLVTNMEEIKHYYADGVEAREGFER